MFENTKTIKNYDEVRDALVEELMDLTVNCQRCTATITLVIDENLEGALETLLVGDIAGRALERVQLYRHGVYGYDTMQDHGFEEGEEEEYKEYVEDNREWYDEMADAILEDASLDIEIAIEEIEEELVCM